MRGSRYAKAAKAAAEEVRKNGKHEPPPEPWSPPVPFGRPGDVPPFPTEVLPPWLRSWVEAEAEATQTPPDLAGGLALAAASAALARRVRVRIRGDWCEPANLFTVVALPPGERKSAVFADATAPMKEYEAELRKEMEAEIAEKASEHRVMELKLKALESKASKEENGIEASKLRQQAKELAKEVAAHVVPAEPQLWADDVTPQKLAQLIARQGGRMMLASDEGTIFEIAKGRYSDTPDFEVFLQGHAGGELRTGRVNRENDEASNIALTCALAVQPDVVSGLSERASMRGRGFLARWFYQLPASKVGRRTIRPAPMPTEVKEAYRQGMLTLWRLPKNNFGLPGGTYELELSGVADAALGEFERWLEPQLAADAPLAALAGWGQKLAGGCARIALVLHMAQTYAVGRAWNEPIDAQVIGAAITLGRDYFLPHAQSAFGLMGADERQRDATRVVGWLATLNFETLKLWKGGRVVTKGDIHGQVFGGTRSVEEVTAICRLLCDHGYLRSPGASWRRDVQLYEVNPGFGTGAENE